MNSDDHLNSFGSDFDGDDYDPFIAEQFSRLDRVPVPALGTRAAVAPVPVEPTDIPRINRFEPRYILAAAAAVIVLAATSFVALRSSGPEVLTDATNNGQTVAESDQQETTDNSAAVQDGASDADKLTVEVTPSSTASVAAVADDSTDQAEDGSSDQAPADDGDEAGNDRGGQTSGDSSDGAEATTTTTPATDDTAAEPTTTTVIDKDSVLVPTTKPGSDTSLDVPVTSFPADGPDRITVIRGMLTEVFTDCQSHLVLDDNNQVVPMSTVSCDGGSYIVVDGKTVRTSSGFVSSDRYYDRHNSLMRPGKQVVVSAVPSELLADTWTLNCASCSITGG